MDDTPFDVRRWTADPAVWEVVPATDAGAQAPPAGDGTTPRRRVHAVAAADGRVWVAIDGVVVVVDPPVTTARRVSAGEDHGLSAPMPARVVSVQVSVGDEVEAGETLVLLEAMKMEVPLRAPHAGLVTAVRCAAGEMVQPGAPLVQVGRAAS